MKTNIIRETMSEFMYVIHEFDDIGKIKGSIY